MNFKTQRGTAIIEYVIILAFICGIGASFTSDGLTKPINSIISKVAAILDLDFDNGGGNLLAGNTSTKKGTFINGAFNTGVNRKLTITGLDDQLFRLNPGTNYEITVDLTKLQKISGMSDADMTCMQLGLFAWENSTAGGTPWLDTADMSFVTSDPVKNKLYAVPGTPYGYNTFSITPTLSADGKTMTYSFTSGNVESYASLVLNFQGVQDEQPKMNEVAPKVSEIISLHQTK